MYDPDKKSLNGSKIALFYLSSNSASIISPEEKTIGHFLSFYYELDSAH